MCKIKNLNQDNLNYPIENRGQLKDIDWPMVNQECERERERKIKENKSWQYNQTDYTLKITND